MRRPVFFIMIFVLTLAFFLLEGPAVSNAQQAPSDTASIEVLRVGRIPYLDPRKMVRNHEKLMEYLKNELGIKEARLVLTPDYNELTQFLKDGKVDIAWHGTFAYPRAREIAGGKAILTAIWSKKKKYSGMIVVRADSNIEKLSDLKGKSFAFVDKKSASGYFLPKVFLLEKGINPDKDFSKVEYLKKHDNILYNILYKKVDAGAVYDTAFDLLKNDEERAQLKMLVKTDEILNEPIMVRAGLPESVTAKIKAAFLKLNSDSAEKFVYIKDLGNIDGFAEAADADYDGIVKMVDKYKHVFEESTSEVSAGTKEIQMTSEAVLKK